MKTAYADNLKMFSLNLPPSKTLSQTPKIDTKLPKDVQELKEQDLRKKMVNAYISNDKYYLNTA